MCKSARERQAAHSGLVRQCLRGHGLSAETVSPLVTYKWLRRVVLSGLSSQRIVTFQKRPAPARSPVEAWLPLSLRCCVLPGFPALPNPLNQATCSCSSLDTADSWLPGDGRPGGGNHPDSHSRATLGAFQGCPRKSHDMGPIHLLLHTKYTRLWEALWDHAGGDLDACSAPGCRAVTHEATP